MFVSIRKLCSSNVHGMAGSMSQTGREMWEATPRSCESCMESPCDVSSLSEVYLISTSVFQQSQGNFPISLVKDTDN